MAVVCLTGLIKSKFAKFQQFSFKTEKVFYVATDRWIDKHGLIDFPGDGDSE